MSYVSRLSIYTLSSIIACLYELSLVTTVLEIPIASSRRYRPEFWSRAAAGSAQ